MRERATINDVALRAGVSIASVSRVVNGGSVRDDTRERVRAAADELGYVPDATGRALRHGSSLQIAFAVDQLANPVYTQMMAGVEDGLRGSGARLLVSSTGHDPDDLMSLTRSLARGFCDGLVISPLRSTPDLLDALVEAPVPVVVIGDVGDRPLDSVRTDSALGIRLAVDHCVARGRSRLAFVNGPMDTTPARRRLAGFTAACAVHGLEPVWVQAADFTVAAGELAWHRIAGSAAVNAVIGANDLLAVGAMRSAIRSGRTVPDDLMVTGMDDIELAALVSPALTTVTLGAVERGKAAAAMLRSRMSNPGAPAHSVTVDPRLIVRTSTQEAR